jgi:hypothetical protein
MIAAAEDTNGGLLDEELIDLNEARRNVIPKKNRRPVSYQAVKRWILDGPEELRLEAVYCGRTPYTSKEAVARFLRKNTEAKLAKKRLSTPASDQELRDAGLL